MMGEPSDRPTGKLRRVGTWVPPVEVDGSTWARAAGPRSRGKLVSAAQHLPPVEAKFIPAPPAWLELVVSFEATTPPVKVFEHTRQLVTAATGAVPELRLAYDLTRSRAENDDVVIALTPRDPAGAAERLAAATEAIRREAERVAPQQRVVVRIGGKAA